MVTRQAFGTGRGASTRAFRSNAAEGTVRPSSAPRRCPTEPIWAGCWEGACEGRVLRSSAVPTVLLLRLSDKRAFRLPRYPVQEDLAEAEEECEGGRVRIETSDGWRDS